MGTFTILVLLTIGIVTGVLIFGLTIGHWLSKIGKVVIVQWIGVVGYILFLWFIFWLLLSLEFDWENIFLL